MALQAWRLGPPYSDRLVLFARCDTTDSVKFRVRKAGVGGDFDDNVEVEATVTADATKDHTAVVTCAGLTPYTQYEIQIEINDSAAFTSSANSGPWTMPEANDSRPFTVYIHSDYHWDDTEDQSEIEWSYAQTDHDFTEPAFVLCIGDMHVNTGLASQADAMQYQRATLDRVGLTAMPICRMFDDWDWAGNNSCGNYWPAFAYAGDPEAEAALMQDWYWRDQRGTPPDEATPSYAYSMEFSNLPFIVTDERSQKIHKGLGGDLRFPGWDLDNPALKTDALCHGSAQLTWIKDKLAEYAQRSPVLYINPSTWGPPYWQQVGDTSPSARDSFSAHYPYEKADIENTMRGLGYDQRLIFFSGDIHYNQLRIASFSGVPTNLDQTQGSVDWATYVNTLDSSGIGTRWGAPPTGGRFMECVVRSGTSATATSEGKDLFGFPGPSPAGSAAGEGTKLIDGFNGAGSPAILRMKVYPRNNGRDTYLRLTWITTSSNPGDPLPQLDNILSGSLGTTMDFWWHQGRVRAYDADDAPPWRTQKYPPDSAPGPQEFRKWYLSDREGVLVPWDRAVRDYQGRLVDSDHLGEPDREELLESHDPPYEIEVEDP